MAQQHLDGSYHMDRPQEMGAPPPFVSQGMDSVEREIAAAQARDPVDFGGEYLLGTPVEERSFRQGERLIETLGEIGAELGRIRWQLEALTDSVRPR